MLYAIIFCLAAPIFPVPSLLPILSEPVLRSVPAGSLPVASVIAKVPTVERCQSGGKVSTLLSDVGNDPESVTEAGEADKSGDKLHVTPGLPTSAQESGVVKRQDLTSEHDVELILDGAGLMVTLSNLGRVKEKNRVSLDQWRSSLPKGNMGFLVLLMGLWD